MGGVDGWLVAGRVGVWVGRKGIELGWLGLRGWRGIESLPSGKGHQKARQVLAASAAHRE